MITTLKATLQPAKNAVNTSVALSAQQIKDGLQSCVDTLDLLITDLDAYAEAQSAKVVPVPPETPLIPAEPGLTPNPLSPTPG